MMQHSLILIVTNFVIFGGATQVITMGGNTASSSGHWTEFRSVNSPRNFYSDSETVADRIAKNTDSECDIWCTDPIQLEWRVTPQNYYNNSVAEIESCVVLNMDEIQTNGFRCKNLDQGNMNCWEPHQDAFCRNNFLSTEVSLNSKRMVNHWDCDLCPDIEVRYKCSNPKPSNPADCPQTSNKRSQDELKQINARIGDLEVQRRRFNERILKESEQNMQRRMMQEKNSDDNIKLLRLIKEYLANKNK